MKRAIQWWQIIAVCILIAGVVLTFWSAQQQDQSLRAVLLTKASIAKSAISAGQVASLSGSAADIASPEYQAMRAQLEKIRASDPALRFAYVTGQRKDGTIIIYADSEPSESATYSPPGQVYTEAPAVLRTLFANGEKVAEGPYTDRWGTWVSGFIPITDPTTGQEIAIFGMDIDAQNWNREIFKASLPTFIATLLLVLLVLISVLFQHRSEEEKRRIQASEEKYRLLVENSHDIIYTLTPDGILTFVSPSWTSQLGHPVTQVIGKSFQQFIHPDDLYEYRAFMQRIIETGQRQTGLEYRVKHMNGSWLWNTSNAIPLKDESGTVVAFEGSASDITEHKRTEENLVAALKRAQKQQEALAMISFSPNLLSGEVHGFSTTLTKISSGVLGVDRVSVWLFSRQGDELRCIDLYEVLYDRHSSEGVLKRHEYVNEFDALSTAKYIDAHDPLTDPRTAGYVEGYLKPNRITSMLDAVIRVSGLNLGVLCFEHVDRSHHWETDEIAFACQLADQIAITLLNRDRNSAEEAVKQTRRNFETFFNTINEFLYVLDEQGLILYTNETVIRRLRYTREELLGQSVLMVHPPERRDEAGCIVQEMLAGTMNFCPVPLMTREGRLIPVETRVIKGKWDGKPVIFGVSKDLSELKISEEKFSAAFHSNASLMAISTKTDGKFIDVNEAFLEVLGFSREDVIGKRVTDLELFVHPEDRSNALRLLEEKGKVRNLEIPVRAKDGDIRYGLFSVDSITIGEVPCLLTTLADITERKLAEDTLKRVNQKLNILSQLTRNDLTNQIFILSSYLELTKNQLAGQEHIINILEKGIQAIQLIHETVEYSKDYQNMGAKPPTWQNMKMALLFGLSHISIGKLQHSIETENLEIFADPLLEKVCQRLFENSVKHGDHVNRIRVWHTTTHEGINIVFEDDGIGIPAEKKEQIFLRRESAHATKRSLIFVREILDITGITIKETGEPGMGARFEIAVPKGTYRFGAVSKS